MYTEASVTIHSLLLSFPLLLLNDSVFSKHSPSRMLIIWLITNDQRGNYMA